MLPTVLNRIAQSCQQAGRDPKSVRLIAVTKGRDLNEIQAAVLEHKHHTLGENRVQEALPKLEALPQTQIHLIGHLQSNKVKFCRDFALIHGVDSPRVLEEFAKRGQGWGFVPPLLLEVNVGRETQKHGLLPEETAQTLRVAQELGLDVRGLMTVAPQAETARVRQVFRELRLLRDSLGLEELSMGMSEDFSIAIEEGATMVRIGRLLFAAGPANQAGEA